MSANPHLLLVLCVLFWAGNFITGRAVNDAISPMALSFLRWALATLLFLPWAWRPMWEARAVLRTHFWRLSLLAVLGITGFNSLIYMGLQNTTAINALLLQSSVPLQIVLLNWLLFAHRCAWQDGVSMLLSGLGVILILGRGDPAMLLQGDWNSGDLWVLMAVFVWAFYSILLRLRPPGLDDRAFLGFTLVLGTLLIAPLWLWELSLGHALHVTGPVVMAVVYVAVFPSLLSYLFWNRGVRLLGANRAGHYIHLNPVFGTLLAVVLLGESLFWFHIVGAALVAAAIGIANTGRQASS